MFTINFFKNEEVSNIQFAINSAILVLDSISKTGNRTVKILSFPNCKDTKPETIIKTVLSGMIAEFKVCAGFDSEFMFFETGIVQKDTSGNLIKEIVKTGIKAKHLFTPFLNSGVILKTDSKGKITHRIECSSGILLKDTALNIKSEQLVTLFEYNSKQFRSALHHTAKAILKQCEFTKLIEQEQTLIEKGLEQVAQSEQKEKQKTLKKKRNTGTPKQGKTKTGNNPEQVAPEQGTPEQKIEKVA